jgi:alpha-L-fucosidase
MLRRTAFALAWLVAQPLYAQGPEGSKNRPERLEWFRDIGFGMFIHWSVDAPLGGVISHSLVGADADYTRRFYDQLPRLFNPRKFHPDDWAELAKLAGMKYVVFTTKHHAGFCMWPTKTTPFSVANTPYQKDITREIVRAFRAKGIAIGFYFSPDDFHYLHTAGKPAARAPHKGVTPQEDAGLMALDRAQLRELLTEYGEVDIWFLDGPSQGLRELVWELQPNAVVTRGGIETPEQRIPGVPIDRPWEACITMGSEWPYKQANEVYKSGRELIELLIETRAKGGNLLLNVGPKPDGELPVEQDERLREIALWNFVNQEAIDSVRPWVVTNEGNVWFTRKKGQDTVYAFLTRTPTVMGERKTVTLRSVALGKDSKVSVLGQTGEILEYRPDIDPRPKWRQDEKGLHLDVMMAQRIYTDRKWPNPIVIKLTNAKPALLPPVVVTRAGARGAGGTSATLRAELLDLGQAPSVQVGFQYRRRKGTEELYAPDEAWVATPLVTQSAKGVYTAEVTGLKPDVGYEFRARVVHPLLTLHGEDQLLPPAKP